jgi:hypothetical protein
MKKIIFSLLASVLVLAANYSFSQSKIVSVSPLTGTANVVIPLYTVSNGQVAVPISISYSGTGVKIKDIEGSAGMNWQLNVGGQISRLVRGLPDDSYKDNSGAAMTGWMNSSNTVADYASTFTIANTGNGNCTNETTDINNIHTNIPYNYDTEPDLFYVDAPGLSCQMIYVRGTVNAFKPVNYSDLVISYTTVGGTGNNASSIVSFTITNDKGIKYVFSAPESVTQTTIAATAPNYFTLQNNRYQNGITYSDSWNLTSITDPNGNAIVFTYTGAPVRKSTDSVTLFLNGSTAGTNEYNVQQSVTSQTLTTISTTNVNNPTGTTSFNFNWKTSGSGQTVINDITGMGRNFQFNYVNATSIHPGSSGYTRCFLTSFSDVGCSTPINYQFNYIGLNTTTLTTTLPDSSSTLVDYWGYFSSTATSGTRMPSIYINPNTPTAAAPCYLIQSSSSHGASYLYTLSGNNRAADPVNVMDGALNNIIYPAGGNTAITYESNDYFDVPSGTTIQGGGIRVKQLVDNDDIAGTSITTNYSYVNSSGVSNGKPTSLPQYAFTIPYSGTTTGQTLWTACTALSAYDLSPEDHTIIYSSVKLSQTGAGSTVYNYFVPATAWDVSASPSCTGSSGCPTNEWLPTVNDVARNSCTARYGPIVANTVYNYPFIPNPNYDFERGLISSIVNYNDASTEVAETDFTYQRYSTPSTITAFKSDNNGALTLMAIGYNHYTIYYNIGELIATMTKKVFDSSTGTTSQTSKVAYIYGSSYHKLMTQEQATNSDNSVSTTYMTYVKDFPASASGSNANVTAIYNLRQENINAPVESYQKITRSSITVTTAANLTLYSASINGAVTNYLPSQQLNWLQPDGAAFTPLSVTATALSYDPNYFVTANFGTYDNTGYLLTADDGNKNVVSTVTDHLTGYPTAIFENARYSEVAFNDFDSHFAAPVNTFVISGTPSLTLGHAGNGANLSTSQTVTSGTITKNTQAQNYIFSVWIDSFVAGTLTLSITGVTPSPTISYTATGWQYCELKIPASAIASSFTLSFSSNQNIVIDDILLYPDCATATTTTYNPTNYYKIAETNTNGVSAYYKSDQWGRLLFKYDQDKNIIEKRTYVTTAQATSGLNSPTLTYLSPVAANVSITFTADTTACITGTSYAWDFGDGTTIPATISGNIQFHTFTAANNYTVKVTASNPLFPSLTSSTPITVQAQLVPTICQSGAPGWNSCSHIPMPAVKCGSNPFDDLHSYYTVTSVANAGSATLTYQWQISTNGGATWSNTGTNSNQLVIAAGTSAYEIRCVVSATGFISGGSNVCTYVVHC